MSLEILQPGLLTSIQDLGRYGHQDQGINVAGVMDRTAASLANGLGGNRANEALIEMTLQGPVIFFQTSQIIALCGADLGATIDGTNVVSCKPLLVKAGSTLRFSGSSLGRYGYLAIKGGLAIPQILGSYSTHLKAGFGGFKGRPLQKGDVIATRESHDHSPGNWAIDTSPVTPGPSSVIRALKGPEWSSLPHSDLLWKTEFSLTQQSDRMGYRLTGLKDLTHQQEIISSAVSFGTVQLPPDGNPIVLMADHQTTGGYPRIAQVITVDLPALAQALPGQKIRFQEVSLKEAQELLYARHAKLEMMQQALRLKWS